MSAESAPLLEFSHLTYHYPGTTHGLENCSLACRAGRRHALLGLNGAGKTTLLLHANGLLRPQQGEVRFDGTPLDYSRAGLTALRRQVGMVFQNPEQQLFSASVEEDIAFGPLNLGLGTDEVRQRVCEALEAVGMAGFAARPVHQLSYGQKKRIAIAGVLAMRPRLLVLDEPFAGLDTAAQAALAATLNALHQSGVTLLLSTHDVAQAYAWADELHILRPAQPPVSLPAADLATHPALLQNAGLELPPILALHRALAWRGLLPPDSPPPRDWAQLLAWLEGEQGPLAGLHG